MGERARHRRHIESFDANLHLTLSADVRACPGARCHRRLAGTAAFVDVGLAHESDVIGDVGVGSDRELVGAHVVEFDELQLVVPCFAEQVFEGP